MTAQELHEELSRAEKIVIGGHWFARVGSSIYRGPVESSGLGDLSLHGATAVAVDDVSADASDEAEDEWYEVCAAHDLLLGDADVRSAVMAIQAELRESCLLPLDPLHISELAEPGAHDESMDGLADLAGPRGVSDEAVQRLRLALEARDGRERAARRGRVPRGKDAPL